jgi:DNA-binding NarL/FixJ family response regulator
LSPDHVAAGPAPVPLRLLIVDDHPLWRRALGRDLAEAGHRVIGDVGTGTDALRVLAHRQIDVVLVDLQLPDVSGAEVTARLRARHEPGSGPQVLIVSASARRDDVLAAMRAGACGYVLKSAEPAELLAAVVTAARGEMVISPEIGAIVLGAFRQMAIASDEVANRLSARELDILGLIARGLSAKAIGARLYLSHRTVENHTQSILRKLHLHNRVELARWALERNLGDPNPSSG